MVSFPEEEPLKTVSTMFFPRKKSLAELELTVLVESWGAKIFLKAE